MSKTKRKAAVAIVLLLCLAMSGIVAFMVDGDTSTNTMTVGKVDISLSEDQWDESIANKVEPLEEFAKNPVVTNDSTVNSCYTFISVEVPVEELTTEALDGTRNTKEDTELFSWTVNDGWELVKTYDDKEGGTKTYVYAYASDGELEELAAGDSTGSLFDYIKAANVVEDEDLELSAKSVVVNAFAIQVQNINEATSYDGSADGDTQISAVWEILNKQRGFIEESDTSNHTTALHYKVDSFGYPTAYEYTGEGWSEADLEASIFYYALNNIPCTVPLCFDADDNATTDLTTPAKTIDQNSAREMIDPDLYYIIEEVEAGTSKFYIQDDNYNDGNIKWISVTECGEEHPIDHRTVLHYKFNDDGRCSLNKYNGSSWVDLGIYNDESMFVYYETADPSCMTVFYDQDNDGEYDSDEQLNNGAMNNGKLYMIETGQQGSTQYYAYYGDPDCLIWLTVTECTAKHVS